MSRSRTLLTAIGAVAAILLAWMVNPWIEVPEGLGSIVSWSFWIVSILLVVLLYMTARQEPDAERVEVEGPAFARFLLSNSRAGLVWLPIRLFLGFTWLGAGLNKATGTGWLDGGGAIGGFWQAAVAIPEQGRPPITYDWYRDFLNVLIANDAQTWFGPLIVIGEIAVGVGLILGVLTGFAAFSGAFMNLSFQLAGSASTNPVMFTLGVGLILAWRVAGYYGVDRWLLPRLGTPWTLSPRREARPALRPSPGQTG